MYQENILRNIILGPIGLVNLLVAKACGASCVAITGKTTKYHIIAVLLENITCCFM